MAEKLTPAERQAAGQKLTLAERHQLLTKSQQAVALQAYLAANPKLGRSRAWDDAILEGECS